jgi:hypothetical protein
MNEPMIVHTGVSIRPISQRQISEDMAAEDRARGGRVHLTQFALLVAGRLRCQTCNGSAYHDADELKCLMCGRTLAWIGQAPLKQEDASADLVDLKSSEQHRKAALARWSGERNTCQRGHLLEGDNVMSHGSESPDCRTCWLARRTACGNGHPYTDLTTYYSADGRKLCTVCRDSRRKRARRAG